MALFRKTPALVAGVYLFVTPAFAQAPVEGRDTSSPASGLSSNAGTILYTELESMRNEVATLRGLVEELTYKINQLEQQRQRDYLDIDRRLQQLTTGEIVASGTPLTATLDAPTVPPLANNPGITIAGDGSLPASTAIPSADPAIPAVTSPVTQTGGSITAGVATTNSPSALAGSAGGGDQAETLYRIAFDELKAGNTDVAIAGFDKVVAQWPTSSWAGDSLYWLGETWAVKGDAAKSSSAYANLIQKMPSHPRAPEAAFKLGRLHHQWGNADSAVRYLRIAADAGVAISASARQFLAENYPNN